MISIVIPSYNQEKYLRQAIESALNQTIKCEVIVIDDGSTDNSLLIAQEYSVKLISQVNKGLASARNTGIMNATGEYILFLDADDMLMPNCAETLLNTGKEIICPSLKCFGVSQETIILMDNPRLEDFRSGNRVGYCGLIKKSILQEIGGYSPRMLHGYEDLHLWMNLLHKGYEIHTYPEPLWMYRTKEQSMWTDAKKHHIDLLAQINKDFPEAKLDFK